MPNKKNVKRGLLRIKRIKILFWVSFAGFIPFSIFFSLLIGDTPFFPILIIIYMVGFMILNFMESLAKCPNCSKPFHSRPLKGKFGGSFMNCFSWSCLNCGISLNAANEAPDNSEK